MTMHEDQGNLKWYIIVEHNGNYKHIKFETNHFIIVWMQITISVSFHKISEANNNQFNL